MLQTLIFGINQSFSQLFRSYATGSKTHYDVLNLDQNCTPEEIREAFIKLTKEYHPDVKGAKTDAKSTDKFVKIAEAYKVLSKTASRNAYDQDLLAGGDKQSRGFKNPEVHRPWEVKPNYNPNPGPYYGIKGLERVSNAKVVAALVVFAMIGVGLGFVSVRTNFTFNRSQLDEKSKEAGEHHAAVRANAQKFGNDEQLKRMEEKMITR